MNLRQESNKNYGFLYLQIIVYKFRAFTSPVRPLECLYLKTGVLAWDGSLEHRELMGKELILQKGFFATSGFCSPPSFSTSASCGHHHLASFSPPPPPLKHGLYHVVCFNSFLIAFLPTVSFPLWSIFYTAISIFLT